MPAPPAPYVVAAARDGRTARAASVGDVDLGDDPRGGDPHQQLAGHAVALAVLVGPLGAHVAAADAGGPPPDLVRLLVAGGLALDHHERERWPVVLHAQGCTTVPPDGVALDGGGTGGEHDGAVVVDVVPDG